jgi:outer membrane lipoprotein-sorting protein
MARGWLGLCAVALGLSLSSGALADAKGNQVLRRTDAVLRSWNTLEFKYKMRTTESGKSPSSMRLRVRLNGDKQFTEILAPADMKGTKVLILSREKTYVYLPAFRKIRRIASHVGEQSFLGTAFSANDMSLTRYAPEYDATVQRETADHYVLKLVGKPGKKLAYKTIEMKVEKAHMVPTDMKYFDDDGKHLKTEARREYVCEANVCQAKIMKMVHHAKGDLTSTLTMKRLKINPTLAKGLFSKRSLK